MNTTPAQSAIIMSRAINTVAEAARMTFAEATPGEISTLIEMVEDVVSAWLLDQAKSRGEPQSPAAHPRELNQRRPRRRPPVKEAE